MRVFKSLGAAALMCLLGASLAFGAMLPQHKRIAVVIFEEASGFFRENLAVDTSSTVITKTLIENGYPVVNAAQVERIKQDKRSELLMNGNPKAIRELGKIYDVRIFLVGKATMAQAVKNDFGTYTATATVTIQGYSTQDGKYLLSEMSSSKQLGGTPDEASQRAVEAAAQELARKLISGPSQSIHSSKAPSSYRKVVVQLMNANDFQGVNDVLGAIKNHSATSEAAVTSYGGGRGSISVSFGGTLEELAYAVRAVRGVKSAVVQGGVVVATFE
ncbi:hypothetical protein TheveDRAFT_1420 [Thermanaerovibrio velox DSM 12556]|uniref:Uncharacterized protein n=1 Tax=Thermanaerovibrio velox DSM 12556 TaxID=926567 RepID=H0UP35_9BACT|nr:hypothetical protein [Thermanaerovibrio velox]EHM10538.1 hypothetical protein TheveDRAFT_1420 [Thermanaerovibrio velox DSM 12556]